MWQVANLAAARRRGAAIPPGLVGGGTSSLHVNTPEGVGACSGIARGSGGATRKFLPRTLSCDTPVTFSRYARRTMSRAISRGMLLVRGTTYRIERTEPHSYSVFRLLDDAEVGTFRTRPALRICSAQIELPIFRDIVHAALRSARTSSVMHALPTPDGPATTAVADDAAEEVRSPSGDHLFSAKRAGFGV